MKPLLLLLLCLLLLSCSERKPDNPFDPQVDISSWTPTNLQIITLSQSSVKLTWTDNSNGLQSGSTVMFKIERKTGNGNYTLAGSTNTNEFTETELSPSTVYRWRLVACLDDNESSYTISNEWLLLPENWAPSNLTIETLSIASIRLSWQDNSFVETGFQIERKTGSGSFVVVGTVNANINQYIDSDLTQNTQYEYRVRAMQNSVYSGYTSVVTLQITPDSWAPTNLTTTTISQTSVRLNWQDNSGFETGFQIERKTGTGNFNVFAGVNANALQYFDLNLSPNTLYTYRVRAVSDINYSNYTSEVSWQITPDSWAPTNLTTTTVSPTSVRLNWQDNSTIEEGFKIERKTGTGSISVIATVNANVVQYTDTNLTSDTQYTYRVRAFAAENYSSYTLEVNWICAPMPANFIQVLGGTFNNGTSDVTVSSFYLDKYELTQAGYQAVMGSNPANGYGVGANFPVYYVSWFNAIEYCNRRSINEGLTPCYSYSTYGTNPSTWPEGWNTNDTNRTNVACSWTAIGYRLPTEAEWQFAARGGNSTHNYTYGGSEDINAVAWYLDNSGGTTHTVGIKAANELGLFDMSGNVFEWNWDIYGTYPSGAQTNPHGAVSGSFGVFRGGSWFHNDYYCAVSYRGLNVVTYSAYVFGFRCVRVSP